MYICTKEKKKIYVAEVLKDLFTECIDCELLGSIGINKQGIRYVLFSFNCTNIVFTLNTAVIQ